MQVVILAGGLGTRISEESDFVPKPMIKIGNMPILWHLIKYYNYFNINDFIICTGYKQNLIKNYFKNKKIIRTFTKNIKIKTVFTGNKSNTGERINRVRKFIKRDFFLTYGDGLSDVNINSLLKFHIKNKKMITVTIVKPPPRFGKILLNKNIVKKFEEKNLKNEPWINGGFFVCTKEIFKFFKKKNCIFERDVLPLIVKKKQLTAYKHKKFWQPMDTLKEKRVLNKIWQADKAPWKKWL